MSSTFSTSPDDFAAALELLAQKDSEALNRKDGFENARRQALAATVKLSQRLETAIEMSRRLGWQCQRTMRR